MTTHDTRARPVRRRRCPSLTRTGQVVVGTVVLAVLVVVERVYIAIQRGWVTW